MEYLDVLNDKNEVIDKKLQNIVHDERLRHRTMMFFVFSSDDKILVTKRSDDKDFFPGYWSIVLGGHVKSGESYEEALISEMKEEINTVGEFEKLGEFVKDIPEEIEHVSLYKVKVEPDAIDLLDKEFQKGEFWNKKKIKREISELDFLPETKMVIKYI
ncbi:MAG: NUDIX hydrolase [Thermoplasmatota archaeon]